MATTFYIAYHDNKYNLDDIASWGFDPHLVAEELELQFGDRDDFIHVEKSSEELRFNQPIPDWLGDIINWHYMFDDLPEGHQYWYDIVFDDKILTIEDISNISKLLGKDFLSEQNIKLELEDVL